MMSIYKIKFKSAQALQGSLPSASQERGIRANITSFGIGLYTSGVGGMYLLSFKLDFAASGVGNVPGIGRYENCFSDLFIVK